MTTLELAINCHEASKRDEEHNSVITVYQKELCDFSIADCPCRVGTEMLVHH